MSEEKGPRGCEYGAEERVDRNTRRRYLQLKCGRAAELGHTLCPRHAMLAKFEKAKAPRCRVRRIPA